MNARHWNDQRWPFLSFLIGCLKFSFCDPSLMFLLSILLPLSQNSCSFFSSFGLFLEFRISSTFFIPSHNSCCFDINNLLNWKIRFLFGLKNQLDKCTVQIHFDNVNYSCTICKYNIRFSTNYGSYTWKIYLLSLNFWLYFNFIWHLHFCCQKAWLLSIIFIICTLNFHNSGSLNLFVSYLVVLSYNDVMMIIHNYRIAR